MKTRLMIVVAVAAVAVACHDGGEGPGGGPEELRLVSELTRERNNLNQLAFLQHAFGVASHEEELRRILRFYDEVIGRLKQKL